MDEEQTPLLLPSLPSTGSHAPLTYRSEVFKLARNTLPITLSFALQQVVQAWSIIIVGRLGTFELGVASYGYMFATCTGSLIAIGGATALDTLCSQALGRTTKDPHVLGIYLQRGLLLLCLQFLITIVPLWWFSSALFMALGQEAEFAKLTGLFLRVLIPGGLLQIYAECLKRFLQIQNLSDAVGWMIVVASVVGIISNYLLVLVAKMGVLGASCSHVIYHLSTAVLLTICAWRSDSARKAWGGFEKKAVSVSGCWEFIKLAVSGILTVATEFWGFETIALMATRLNETSIGAQSIIMSSDQILACVPLGLGVATAHRIGNLLGSGDSKGAKFMTRIPYIVALLVGLTEGLLIMLTRRIYGYIFSDSQAVVSLTASILPLIAVFQCVDISNSGAAGILRGAGKTHLAGLSNIIAYYGVGITSAYYMCFWRGLDLFGLWAGIIAGSVTLFALQALWVSMINWDGESRKISVRLSRT